MARPVKWLKIPIGLPEDPRCDELASILGIDKPHHLLLDLWLWVARYHQDGDLSSIRDATLERRAGWTGEAGAFVEAMTTVGFLDEGRNVLAEWVDDKARDAKRKASAPRVAKETPPVSAETAQVSPETPQVSALEEKRGEEIPLVVPPGDLSSRDPQRIVSPSEGHPGESSNQSKVIDFALDVWRQKMGREPCRPQNLPTLRKAVLACVWPDRDDLPGVERTIRHYIDNQSTPHLRAATSVFRSRRMWIGKWERAHMPGGGGRSREGHSPTSAPRDAWSPEALENAG